MSNLFILTGQEDESDQVDKFGYDGMPEFVQEDKSEFHMIKVRFNCEQDVLDFAKALGQPHITTRTKFTWYPRQRAGASLERWIGDTSSEAFDEYK
jgi:hypothetical protein